MIVFLFTYMPYFLPCDDDPESGDWHKRDEGNSMKTRAVVVYGPDLIGCEDVEIPGPEAGEVLVRAAFSCVSPGTELRCLSNPGGGCVLEYPYVGGYSMAGVVVESGAGVGLKPGTRVFCGRTDRCSVPLQWGAHVGMAVRSVNEIIVLPDGLSLKDASIGKLAAIARHGSRFSEPQSGVRVAVVGLGPIGQLSARIHAALGADVVGVDRVVSRVNALGAAGVRSVESGTRGLRDAVLSVFPDGVDVLVDATGVPELVSELVTVVKSKPWGNDPVAGGRYLVQGSYPQNVSFPYDAAFQRELSVWFSRDSQKGDLEEALKLIASGRLNVSDLVRDEYCPEDAVRAYSDLRRPEIGPMTAVFRWGDGS